MSSVTKCVCCGEEAQHNVLVEVRKYNYLLCKSCDSAFLGDVNWEAQKAVHTGRDYKLMRVLFESTSYQYGHENWLVNTMKKAKPSGSVLEVGCGSGFFLKVAKDHDYQVIGMDLGGENVLFADQYLGVDVRDQDFLSATGQFDWVVMHQLIEHIPNPGDFIAKAYELLKPGGMLMITTPNLFFAKVMVRVSRMIFLRPRLGDAFGHPPSHCVIFSPESLSLLVEKHGLHVTSLMNNPSGMKTKSAIRRWIDKIIVANLPWTIGPNMLLCATRKL